jgi:DNA helicase II / ATP-dependent DNA helicase PcrA
MPFGLERLDEAQRRAAQWKQGSLLLLGGAGCGKTEILVRRVAWRCSEAKSGEPMHVGLTFSRRASEEWRARVEALVPEARTLAKITTPHAFAVDILRHHGKRVGVLPDFAILNQPEEQLRVLQDAIEVLRRQDENLVIEDATQAQLERLEAVMERLVPEHEIIERSHNKEVGAQVALLYKEYRRQLIAQNYLDFPSILVFACELLSGCPDILVAVQNSIASLSVDELQDMDAAQYQLIYHLAGETPNDMVLAADEDQILYQWSGASPERLAALLTRYNMQIIALSKSYRCPKSVIELANKLIDYNRKRIPQTALLTSAKDDEGHTEHIEYSTLQEELAAVVATIKGLPAFERGRCLVVARTRKLLEDAVRSLRKANLHSVLAAPKREFESAPIRWLHSVLRLANRPADHELLRRVNKAFYELEGVHVQVEGDSDLLQKWFSAALAMSRLEKFTRSFLERVQSAMKTPKGFLSLPSMAFSWFDEVDKRLSGLPQEEFVDFREEQRTFEELQKTILEIFGEARVTLPLLLQELDLSPKLPPLPVDAVKCLTIHTAKGLSFDHVFLIGMVEGFLPSFRSVQENSSPKQLEEERRSCLVAVTRTTSSLRISYAQKYFGWKKAPSRFLEEMDLMRLAPIAD